jgi:peptidoglycan/xylan/chitin deacetylase (PgdA/CDA1 family)
MGRNTQRGEHVTAWRTASVVLLASCLVAVTPPAISREPAARPGAAASAVSLGPAAPHPAPHFLTVALRPAAARALTPAQRARARLLPKFVRARSPLMLRMRANASRLIRKLNVRERVVFITIDDGWSRDHRVVKLLRRSRVPVTAFLIRDAASDPKQVRFYRALQRAGATIEDHTISHPFMPGLSESQQRTQICHTARAFGRVFGRKPSMFRPPYGAYNGATLRAAARCGMGATFMWSAEVRNRRLSTDDGPLGPGDIILMHFRPELYSELKALLSRLRARHLGVGSLEDYVRFR